MLRKVFILLVSCIAICFSSFASYKDSIQKTYVIVHFGRYCKGDSDIIIQNKFRIIERCGGCCIDKKIARQSRRNKRIVKRKFGLDY